MTCLRERATLYATPTACMNSFGGGGRLMARISDEEYYEHWGEWYLLEGETDALVALMSAAAARFRTDGFPEPVNAVEIGWNLEGSFLNVCFVSNPDYSCYGQ